MYNVEAMSADRVIASLREKIDKEIETIEGGKKQSPPTLTPPELKPSITFDSLGLSNDVDKEFEEMMAGFDDRFSSLFTPTKPPIHDSLGQSTNDQITEVRALNDQFSLPYAPPVIETPGGKTQLFDQDNDEKTDQYPHIIILDTPDAENYPDAQKTVLDWGSELDKNKKLKSIASILKSAYIYFQEHSLPVLEDGVEPIETLEYPQSLTDIQVIQWFTKPGKQFTSLFLTASLLVQSSHPPTEKFSERPTPPQPPAVWVTPEAPQPPIIIDMAKLISDLKSSIVIADLVAELQAKEGLETISDVQRYINRDPSVQDNLRYLAEAFKKHGILTLRNFAYLISTLEVETAHTLQPVVEGFYIDDEKGWPYGTAGRQIAIKNGYQGGAEFYGKGFIQFTHEGNYIWLGRKIGVDLLKNPQLLMDPKISAEATAIWFKYKLDGYNMSVIDHLEEDDLLGARLPINGTDKRHTIADRALELEKDVTIHKLLAEIGS